MVARAEHRRQTLLDLGDAAVELFASEGSSVTIESIAKRAGLSRRTVFRYVSSKEELAFVHPTLWLDVFDAAITSHTGAPSERLHDGGMAVAAHIDADPKPVQRAMSVVLEQPELFDGYPKVFIAWVDALANVALTDPADPDDRFRSRVIGSAMMGMIDAILREWLMGAGTMAELFTNGFDLLRPLFSDE